MNGWMGGWVEEGWVLGVGCWVLGVGCWVLGVGLGGRYVGGGGNEGERLEESEGRFDGRGA
jgi:hypothetical protein